MTKDILFNNSNVLYDLRYEAVFDETVQAPPKQLTYNPKSNTAASPYRSPTATPGPNTSAFDQAAASEHVSRSVSPYAPPPAFPPPPKVPRVYDVEVLENFRQENPKIKFVYVQWLDYMATVR